jgi:hypothetical protein
MYVVRNHLAIYHGDGQTVQQGCHFEGLPPHFVAHFHGDISSCHQHMPVIGQNSKSQPCQMILLGSQCRHVFAVDPKFPVCTFISLLEEFVLSSIVYTDVSDFLAHILPPLELFASQLCHAVLGVKKEV